MSKAHLVFSTIAFGFYEIQEENLVDANGNPLVDANGNPSNDKDYNFGVLIRFPGLRPLFAAVKEEFFIRCSIFDVPEPAQIKVALQAFVDRAMAELESQNVRLPLRPDYNAQQIFRWSLDWFQTEPGTGEALNLPIGRVDPFEPADPAAAAAAAPAAPPAGAEEPPVVAPIDPAAAGGGDFAAMRQALSELEAINPYKWLIRLNAPRRMMPDYRAIKGGPNYGHIYHV